ncbi:MAG TPA: LysR substrate-binding domain-containing protein [Bordetella sp.]
MAFDSGDVAHKLNNRLKMRHLALLLQIRQHGSLTRAAEHMAISQPALTNTLAELEGMFGAPLFERSARGMAPTLLGRVVLAHAQAMIQDLDHLVRDMDAVAGGHTAHLHVGVTPFVPGRVLPAALQQAARDGRHLTVTVHEGPGELLLPQLQDHTLDIVVGQASPALNLEGLGFDALYSQSPRLIANRRLAARLSRQRLDWPRLAGLDWIMSPSTSYLREQVASLFVEAGLPAPRPVVETDVARLIGDMLAASERAVAILPADIAEELVRVAGVAIIPYSFAWSLPPIGFFTRHSGTPRMAEQWFADALRKASH